ncbi:MAG: DUF6785 family protein [Armatimonadota bacterium]
MAYLPADGKAPQALGITDPRRIGVTPRVLALVALLIPADTYFIADLHRRGIEDPTIIALFWNVLFLFVVLRLVNGLAARVLPRRALAQQELLVLWILLSVATCPTGLDTLKTSWATMQGYAYFQGPQNNWERIFGEYVPESMTVSDMAALERLWVGDHSIFEERNWRPWLGPVMRWVLLFAFLWGGSAGLAVIFRKRWVERERMTFPIVQLPFELSRPAMPSILLASFWVAFGVAALVNLLNGLHAFYPGVPQVPVKIGQAPALDLNRYLTGRPWNAMGRVYAAFYPFGIGLGLLIPQELALSMWLFFLMWRAEAVFVAWMGWSQATGFPHMKEQSFGGYLAILGFSLWAGRGYFREVGRRIVGLGNPSTDADEPMRYQTAFAVFLVGFVAVCLLGVSIKLTAAVAIAFFVQYFIMTMIVGRIRAEMGLPTHEIERLGPTVMQGNILGPRILGLQNLTSLSLFFGFTRGLRNIPYPLMLEGLYLSGRTGLDGRRLLIAAMAVIPIATFFAYFWNLMLGYEHGIGADWNRWMPWSSQEAWRQLEGWLSADRGYDWGRTVAIILGFAFYFGLQTVRSIWVWWPLHPAGFAISTTYYMQHLWMPMLVAWAIKSLASRYGGRGSVRHLQAIAFGLILGDVMLGSVWAIYSAITRVESYAFWP